MQLDILIQIRCKSKARKAIFNTECFQQLFLGTIENTRFSSFFLYSSLKSVNLIFLFEKSLDLFPVILHGLDGVLKQQSIDLHQTFTYLHAFITNYFRTAKILTIFCFLGFILSVFYYLSYFKEFHPQFFFWLSSLIVVSTSLLSLYLVLGNFYLPVSNIHNAKTIKKKVARVQHFVSSQKIFCQSNSSISSFFSSQIVARIYNLKQNRLLDILQKGLNKLLIKSGSTSSIFGAFFPDSSTKDTELLLTLPI